jgi:hypothetical protein
MTWLAEITVALATLAVWAASIALLTVVFERFRRRFP